MMSLVRIAGIILIIVLGFLVYHSSLDGAFVWDDHNLIRFNSVIKSWSNIPQIFTSRPQGGIAYQYSFYRPVQFLTYMFDHSLWGMKPYGYHLTSTGLHILVALSLCWLVYLIFGDYLLALGTACLFVVHPIHAEAVSYISGRADPLAALFMLLSFIFYLKNNQKINPLSYILMLLCYILALLSRENSLILPILILLYHYSFRKSIRKEIFAPIASIAIIYVFLRFTILKALLAHTMYPSTLFQRIPGFFVAIADYVRLLIAPFGLHMEYGNRLFDLSAPAAILGLLVLFFPVFIAYRKRARYPLVFFAVSWFFVALLPHSNLYPINAFMSEHWLYVPSMGFFLLLAAGLCALYGNKKYRVFACLLAAGLLSLYSWLTIRQGYVWSNPITFYERTLKYAPDSARIYVLLGNEYVEAGKKEEAIGIYQKAISIDPYTLDAYYCLSTVYNSMGRKDEARAAYNKIVEINPDYRRE